MGHRDLTGSAAAATAPGLQAGGRRADPSRVTPSDTLTHDSPASEAYLVLAAERDRLSARVERLELALFRHAADRILPRDLDRLERCLQARGYTLD